MKREKMCEREPSDVQSEMYADVAAWMMASMSSLVGGFEGVAVGALSGIVDGSGEVGLEDALETLS